MTKQTIRAKIQALLDGIDEGLYLGALSDNFFYTNGKRSKLLREQIGLKKVFTDQKFYYRKEDSYKFYVKADGLMYIVLECEDYSNGRNLILAEFENATFQEF